MLDVVTFKWKPAAGYRSTYDGSHVNVMRSMVARNYPAPHRFHCVTDDATGIDGDVIVHKLGGLFASMESPHGKGNPSCYRRLFLWSPQARDMFGERILSIDLDMLLVADVSPLWDRPEPVVMWADNLNPSTPYNGAMQLHTAGARPRVWSEFDPNKSPGLARAKGYFGSDQAWLSYALGPNEARWKAEDGAMSWRVHCRKTQPGNAHLPFALARDDMPVLPAGAKILNFHGIDDPWTVAPSVPWVLEHYK